jgi:hypothetical protein
MENQNVNPHTQVEIIPPQRNANGTFNKGILAIVAARKGFTSLWLWRMERLAEMYSQKEILMLAKTDCCEIWN